MKLVTRSDGVAINLESAISFRPVHSDVIVEYPNDDFYIIINCNSDQLYSKHNIRREFKGWPG